MQARTQQRWRRLARAGMVGLWMVAGVSCRPEPELPPAEALAKAWEEFEFYDYPAAQRLLRPLVEGQATGTLHAEALFALANCLEHRQPRSTDNLAQARSTYHRLIEEHPDSPLVGWARLAVARIADLGVDRGDPVEAGQLYREVIDRHPKHEAAAEAALRLGQTLMNDPDAAGRKQGIATLEAWLKSHPKSALAGSMHMVLGHAYLFGLDACRPAVAHYVAADELGIHNHTQVGNVYYRIAYLAQHRLKDHKLARTYYRKLIDEVFRDPRAYRAKVAIRQMDQQERRGR